MIFRYALAVFAGGWLLALSPAQSEEPLPFTLLAAEEGDTFELLFDNAEGEQQETEFWPSGRSRVFYHDPSDGLLIFYLEEQNEEGETVRVPQAVADMRDVQERGLLVFLRKPDASRGLPHTVWTAEEGEAAFPSGSFRVLNLTGVPLLGQIGGKEELFEKGFSQVLPFDPSEHEPLRIRFAVWKAGRWEIVFSSASQAHPTLGTLIILRPPADPSSLRVRAHLLRERTY